MDGNLLDPDNVDATLAKEWRLPELPAGVEEKLFVIQTSQYTKACCSILFKAHHFALATKNSVYEGQLLKTEDSST